MEYIEKQKELFCKLTEHRERLANALEQPALAGVQRSVVDKYSDQAHFIYELLQNADDALATESKFILSNDELIFIHNGKVPFTVSNPDDEGKDSEEKNLGHINAITSIGNTTKDKAKIGKFGVGFKAIFQYSKTPHIYDPNFSFKIERFIVPHQLEQNHSKREPKETLFYFPFDLKTKSKVEAANDILQKLKSLVHPVLFLSNLKKISWETPTENGKYTKTVSEEKVIGETTYQLLNLVDGNTRKQLWLFTRELEESSHKYSVGFFLDKNKKLETSKSYSAFCFFPTKENTNLKFIIQAPFLLTDSREGIKAGESWNENLINKLSVLAAECLPILKKIGVNNGTFLLDDNIVNLIPYKETDFSNFNDRNKISFRPFYSAIKGKLQSESLLPAKNNKYSSKNLSYWASDTELTELFSDKQIADLMEKENARWVFPSLGRKQVAQTNQDLLMYIDGGDDRRGTPSNLIITNLDPEKIFRKFTAEFIEQQSFTWLKKLYSYLLERRALWEKEGSVLRSKPIFINSDGKAVSAFDSETEKNLVLFFPSESVTTNQTINKYFLNHHDSKQFFIAFGIDTPRLKDEIYNNIIPQYKNGFDYSNTELIKQHFNSFLQYFDECPQTQREDYINELKEIKFIACRTKKHESKLLFKTPSKLYFPHDDLKIYFQNKHDAPFIDLDFYGNFILEKNKVLFETFIVALGVNETPVIYEYEIQNDNRNEYTLSHWTRYSHAYESYFDGAEEVIENLTPQLSFLLWKFLCKSIKLHNGFWNFITLIKGRHTFFYGTDKEEQFNSAEYIRLTQSPWLYTKENSLSVGSSLSVDDLAEGYDTISTEAKSLMEMLEISNPDGELNLTAEQMLAYEFGKKLLQHGVTQKDLPELLQMLLQKQTGINTDTSTDEDDDEETAIDKTLKKIKDKFKNRDKEETAQENTSEENEEIDEDEFTKQSVDFEKKISRKEEQLKAEIEQLTKIQQLTEAAAKAEKYSFIWFKSLLELEYLNSSENNSKGKEISIQFTKVEKEIGTDRTLILKHPNRYIPQSIEDIGDLTVRLYYGNESSSVSVEVVSVKEYTLRAKLTKTADISDVDLSTIHRAVIDIKNPVFILDELKKNFIRLPFEDSDNLKKMLTKNIEFVFGPPGTGKTTFLSNEVLIPLMQREEDLKILVLTPTNKAADVLVNRITETMNGDESYLSWLVRFGFTGDSAIEKSPIFCDKTFDIRTKPRNVTVTTIARFPYDYFQPDPKHRLHLRELHWDYIVIDEASMIPLVNIIFPLYYKTEAKFIIAGDPFQIQPITSVNQWKDENIYTLVELNNFKNPTTTPHEFIVKNLPIQYRSIPAIGTLFSHFTYDGILKSNRKENSQRPLNLDGLKIKDINIVKFPVSPFESIYRAKKLNQSSNYQIYSAIFTYEFAKYISAQISKNHNEHYRIGIICPYKAQASLVDKLFASRPFDTTNVEIQVGTIHGFQGDECDIIISCFNPPPYISDKPEMFLNKQNILNVSISRARDYLFILMPDDKTENLFKLKKIQRIVQLVNEKAKGNSTVFHSSDIERVIFKNQNFIYENSFSTTHQSVNVYSEAEMLYEIRCEESAIDIQVSTQKTNALVKEHFQLAQAATKKLAKV
jgi:hypothetical protein